MILEKELKHKDELIEEINALISENSRLKAILKKVFKEDNMNAVYEKVERMEYQQDNVYVNNESKYSGVKEHVQEMGVNKEEVNNVNDKDKDDNNIQQSQVIEIKKEEVVKEEVSDVDNNNNKDNENHVKQSIETAVVKEEVIETKVSDVDNNKTNEDSHKEDNIKIDSSLNDNTKEDNEIINKDDMKEKDSSSSLSDFLSSMKPRNTSDINHEVKENNDDKKELATTEEKEDLQLNKEKEIEIPNDTIIEKNTVNTTNTNENDVTIKANDINEDNNKQQTIPEDKETKEELINETNNEMNNNNNNNIINEQEHNIPIENTQTKEDEIIIKENTPLTQLTEQPQDTTITNEQPQDTVNTNEQIQEHKEENIPTIENEIKENVNQNEDNKVDKDNIKENADTKGNETKTIENNITATQTQPSPEQPTIQIEPSQPDVPQNTQIQKEEDTKTDTTSSVPDNESSNIKSNVQEQEHEQEDNKKNESENKKSKKKKKTKKSQKQPKSGALASDLLNYEPVFK